MVRVEGLEPPRLAASEPKSGASTNFAIPAYKLSILPLGEPLAAIRGSQLTKLQLLRPNGTAPEGKLRTIDKKS